MSRLKSPQSRSGFTLAEILLAMMVFAIAITTILALLARSIETADSIIVKDEAIGLSSAVDSYMSELSFLEAYEVVRNNVDLFAYQYRATQNTDGTLQAYPVISDTAKLGETYIISTGVRKEVETTELEDDIPALEGRLFRVILSVSPANPFDDGSNPKTIPSGPNDAGTGGFPKYDSAVLVIFAEFYPVPGQDFDPVANDIDPVFSFNFAVRR